MRYTYIAQTYYSANMKAVIKYINIIYIRAYKIIK